MHRTTGYLAWVVLAAAAAIAPFACAPDSAIPPPGSSSSASSGGVGGDPLSDCADPTDDDGDLVANALELAPDVDTDADGQPDAEDDDSDGDGYPDADEAENALLVAGLPGRERDDPCDAVADTDGDGSPDLRDLDSDNDGVPDADEAAYDADGALGCRVEIDCDGDGVIDLIELAAGSDPADGDSTPDDVGLYFVLPYQDGEKTKDFDFATGVSRADIYFLVDTTASMQPAIDALKASLSTSILPGILNGDLAANPPIPPITDAWIGIGDVRDVPWDGYGQPGDSIYRNRFVVGGPTVIGNVAPPVKVGSSYVAPESVETILGSLTAAGGGDAPEATTQALWIASTNQPFVATVNGLWQPAAPYPAPCDDPTSFGVPCFRDKSLPIFVVVTDAPFHNGPVSANAYDPSKVGGVKSYAETVSAIGAIGAKVVGVPVAGNTPGAARADLEDLATQTGSLYHEPAFGGQDVPLVPKSDVSTGNVSSEVVDLLGRLAGAGLHDVTTSHATYDCDGGKDCTGDGSPDPKYENPVVPPDAGPYDAAKLITAITPVASPDEPPPYGSLDATTFHAVRGAATVTFRVHAENTTIKPTSLLVLRAIVRVETPSGQLLGGPAGIKLVYFVIPPYVVNPK